MRQKLWVLFVLICIGTIALYGCSVSENKDSQISEQTEIHHSQEDTESEQSEDTERVDDTTEDTQTVEQSYSYIDISKKMYTIANVNIRNMPTVEGTKVGSLSARRVVYVTGQCKETGWYRINYNEGIAYVSNNYLVEELESSWVSNLKVAETVSQMIIVTADSMGTTDVKVSMHTKDENGIWTEDFSTPGKIGRNGLGKEKEGDGKTPIGVFDFTSAFGILPNPGVNVMPYLQVDETHHWVDDPNSKYYNQCVSTRDVEIDWNSSEHLCEYAGSYNYSLSTSYNEACTPWVGCAIFLHCTSPSVAPTAGCIAIPEEYMIQTLQKLKADCVIIIDIASEIHKY